MIPCQRLDLGTWR